MDSCKTQDKKLFTPGPLCVSPSVRDAMNRDIGSRDPEFIQIIQSLRHKLIEIGGFTPSTHTCILIQGSGTFSVEATLQSTSNRNKKVLILSCGAYGFRMSEICLVGGIPFDLIEFPETTRVSLNNKVRDLLDTGKYCSLALVHCETTSGILNPIEEIGIELKKSYPTINYIVDGMSSFGGVVGDYKDVDFLISSANKCLQGVPGFGFVICKIDKLKECKDLSTSLSLDLYKQWIGFEESGQFRFTPPTHCILGLRQALIELDEEGGVVGRVERYKTNNLILKKEMKSIGFDQFILDEFDCWIITSYKYPINPNFNFNKFYTLLSERGQIIYPGKVTNANCFRIGNIGYLFPNDIITLINHIKNVLEEMNVSF